jgi:hypothetical protein
LGASRVHHVVQQQRGLKEAKGAQRCQTEGRGAEGESRSPPKPRREAQQVEARARKRNREEMRPRGGSPTGDGGGAIATAETNKVALFISLHRAMPLSRARGYAQLASTVGEVRIQRM